tara:strand:- start:662 stop:874 length:213 start_codon:yes stop_codon:yes gene_type:complete
MKQVVIELNKNDLKYFIRLVNGEKPYKDNDYAKDDEFSWTADKCNFINLAKESVYITFKKMQKSKDSYYR